MTASKRELDRHSRSTRGLGLGLESCEGRAGSRGPDERSLRRACDFGSKWRTANSSMRPESKFERVERRLERRSACLA